MYYWKFNLFDRIALWLHTRLSFFLGSACQFRRFRIILFGVLGGSPFYWQCSYAIFPSNHSFWMQFAVNGIAFFHDFPENGNSNLISNSIYSAVGCRPNSSTDFRWILLALVTCRSMNRCLPPWAPGHQGIHGWFINFEFTNCDLSVVGRMCVVRMCICARGKCNQFFVRTLCMIPDNGPASFAYKRQHPQSCLLGRN